VSHEQIPTVASEKRVQASYPGDTALSTSSVDYEFHPDVRPEQCRLRKEARVSTTKEEIAMKASRETIKIKTPEGEVKVAVPGDSPGAEEYLHHINNFIRMLGRKKIEEDMLKLAKTVLSLKAQVRKLKTAPQGEKPVEKTSRLGLLEAATTKLVEAEVCEDAKMATVYDLFRKTLKEDPELQWDRIVKDTHTKDPWEDLKGIKHGGVRMRSNKSLWECIDFHKLMVYSINAAEQQRLYILCHLKKPARSSIQAHMTRMETLNLNKYLEQLPTIKNSPQAVVMTEYGNVPFNKSTLASILLNHLPVAWRNQYNVTHPIVPEFLRAILLDLKNLEKVFVEKSNEAVRANKAKVTAAAKRAGEHVPRKGKHAHGGGPEKGTPKKGRTNKFCKWCKAVDGPFMTHNTTECRRFNKDGSPKDRLTKPFDSTKKPWKKPGSGELAQMAYLTEEMAKLKKKLKKSKKHGKKRARDSSYSDSNSD